MAVPTTIADLSTTAALNSPAGSDNLSTADDYLRAIQGIVKTVYTDSSARSETLTNKALNGSLGATTPSTAVCTTVEATSTIKGATTISVGAATPSASGAGITFPATQSASTDANTLDDYEEGTWTPTLVGSTSGSATSGGNTYGNYTKVGQLVTLNFVISISAVSTLVGAVYLSGLPFALASAGASPPNRYPQGATIFGSLGTLWASILIGSDGNTTTLDFSGTKIPATGTTNVLAADLTATSFFAGSIQYIV